MGGLASYGMIPQGLRSCGLCRYGLYIAMARKAGLGRKQRWQRRAMAWRFSDCPSNRVVRCNLSDRAWELVFFTRPHCHLNFEFRNHPGLPDHADQSQSSSA